LFRSVGVELFRSPRTIMLDGRPIPDWLTVAEKIHDHVPLV
jgi:hypothetical protein